MSGEPCIVALEHMNGCLVVICFQVSVRQEALRVCLTLKWTPFSSWANRL